MKMMMKLKGGKDWMVMTKGRQCNLTHWSNQNTIDRCDNDDDDHDDHDHDDDDNDQSFHLIVGFCNIFEKPKFLNQIFKKNYIFNVLMQNNLLFVKCEISI